MGVSSTRRAPLRRRQVEPALGLPDSPREMTREEICNVRPLDADDLAFLAGLLGEDDCWTLVDGGER